MGVLDKFLGVVSSAKEAFVDAGQVDRDAKIANIEDYHQMLQMAQVAPLLSRWFSRGERIAKVFGVDFPNGRKMVDELNRLMPEIESLANFPDEFNSVFASRGWIVYDGLNHDVAQQALLASKDSLEQADAILTGRSATLRARLCQKSPVCVSARWPQRSAGFTRQTSGCKLESAHHERRLDQPHSSGGGVSRRARAIHSS